MLSSRLAKPLALMALVAVTAAAPSPKSDPVGIYAIIDRVVLEPDAGNAKTIQIWGVFAISEAKPGDTYKPIERGYLYYSVNASNERATLAEWADLKAVAGKNQPVGFGAKYKGLGHLRHANEAPANPETYPLGIGLMKVLDQYSGPDIVRQLQAAHAPAKPPKPETSPSPGLAG
jgi:hypothetical protein